VRIDVNVDHNKNGPLIPMIDCTPYLLALGLTKSRTSLVWIAGPLSGLIMQPIIGVLADRSKSKYGRRRPFMVIGSIVVAGCLLVLGWAKELVAYFVEEGEFRKSCTIFVAVFSIYAVDFAINAGNLSSLASQITLTNIQIVQASRSLIVDTLPIPKQQSGSAWASRMVASGHLVGYVIGTMDLVSIFGTTFGDTQFKQLTVVAAIALLFTTSVTCWAVNERILIAGRDGDAPAKGLKIIKQIFVAATSLPPRIQAICVRISLISQ